MQIDGSDLALIGTAIVAASGGIFGAIKWMTSRIDRRFAGMEKERKEREAELTRAHEAEQERCHQTNIALTGRIQHLEDRSHDENREDRISSMQVLKSAAAALELHAKITERLAMPTPPTGNKVIG